MSAASAGAASSPSALLNSHSLLSVSSPATELLLYQLANIWAWGRQVVVVVATGGVWGACVRVVGGGRQRQAHQVSMCVHVYVCSCKCVYMYMYMRVYMTARQCVCATYTSQQAK